MRAKPLSRSLVYWCVAVFVLAVCCALVPGRAFAEVAGPFEVEGPTDSFEWDGSTLTITANGVTFRVCQARMLRRGRWWSATRCKRSASARTCAFPRSR